MSKNLRKTVNGDMLPQTGSVLGLHRISAEVPAIPESGLFRTEIRSNFEPDLAGASAAAVKVDKSNANDLSSGVIAILISVTRMKKQKQFNCRSTNLICQTVM